jgi:hypothetical protein
LVYRGDQLIGVGHEIDYVHEALGSECRLCVAEHARRRVFVHAGAVGWRGQGIILPGQTMSGKSTLVVELLRAGAEYYSDDFAVLDASGHLFPFHKPLSLREEGSVLQRHIPIEELHALPGVAVLPIGLVIVSQYKPGAAWRPRQISPGLGILELLSNTVPARRRPRAALAALQEVVSQAPVFVGQRGEAHEAAAWILEKVGARPVDAVT